MQSQDNKGMLYQMMMLIVMVLPLTAAILASDGEDEK
jgi:ABC-type phosphate transport system permease subunit